MALVECEPASSCTHSRRRRSASSKIATGRAGAESGNRERAAEGQAGSVGIRIIAAPNREDSRDGRPTAGDASILGKYFHQAVSEFDVLIKGLHSDSLVPSMRAGIVQIIEQGIYPITGHALRSRVAAIAGAGRHLRQDDDLRPEAVHHALDLTHEARGQGRLGAG